MCIPIDEATVIICEAKKTFVLSNCFGNRPFSYYFDLTVISFSAPFQNSMSQVSQGFLDKLELTGFQL